MILYLHPPNYISIVIIIATAIVMRIRRVIELITARKVAGENMKKKEENMRKTLTLEEGNRMRDMIIRIIIIIIIL